MNSRPKLLENPDRLTTIDPDYGYENLDANENKAIMVDPKDGNDDEASRFSNITSSCHESKVLLKSKIFPKPFQIEDFSTKNIKKHYQT